MRIPHGQESGDSVGNFLSASANRTRVKVAVVINFMSSYRESFYEKLLNRTNLDVVVYCHEVPTGSSLKSVHHKFPRSVRVIDGSFIGGETLVWSKLPWKELLFDYDVVYVEGNPRYAAFALLATILRFMGKPVVLWTMVHSYRQSISRQRLRLSWTRLFRNLLVYSDAEVRSLVRMGFKNQKIIGINNGLDQAKIDSARAKFKGNDLLHWQHENGLAGRRMLLSCARLEKKNKFDQMLAAIQAITAASPDVVWCIIGSGAELELLTKRSQDLGVVSSVRFLGAIHQEDALAPWFLSAKALVHPGAIGLSLLHSFGYGLPVITHDNDGHHGPEFAAFVNGVNGLSYREDSIEGLTGKVIELLNREDLAIKMGQNAWRVVREQWNTDVMLSRFLEIGSLELNDAAS